MLLSTNLFSLDRNLTLNLRKGLRIHICLFNGKTYIRLAVDMQWFVETFFFK